MRWSSRTPDEPPKRSTRTTSASLEVVTGGREGDQRATGLAWQPLEVVARQQPVAGARLEQDDDVVDETIGEFFGGLGKESETCGLETAIQLSRIGRYLERIADHGVTSDSTSITS